VAYIQRQFQIGHTVISRGSLLRSFFLVIHGWLWLNGGVIKTKLDNANWLPIRHADTPVQKRFLDKPGRTQIRLGLSSLPDAFSSAHILCLRLFPGDGANHTLSPPLAKWKMIARHDSHRRGGPTLHQAALDKN
jgi:hypothetical protein